MSPTDAASAAPTRPAPPRAWLRIAIAVFAVAYGGNEFTPMMVMYRQEGVFSPLFVDLLLANYAAGIAIALLLFGPLSDRIGRRAIFLPSPLLALAGSLLIAAGETTEPLILLGRFLSGLSIGMAMTAGGSWIKELSVAPFDPTAAPNAGAKRAAMALTGGFGLGALIAGTLAEWAPWPGQLPYALHVLLSAATLLLVLGIPETRRPTPGRSFWQDMMVPSVFHPRILTLVLPVAPWIFGSAGVAYAIIPSRTQGAVDIPIAFSAAIAAISLFVGFGVQQIAGPLLVSTQARAQQVALAFVIAGFLLAAWTASSRSLLGAVAVAVILGTGYGLCLISCLTEAQRVATPAELGGLTAVVYVFAYVGFFFPMICTRLSEWFTYPQMLYFGAAVATASFALVRVAPRFVPPPPSASS